MSESKNIRVLTGVVVSTARDKTIAVEVERKTRHPKYKKYIKLTSKFHAHIEADQNCKSGDVVSIQACRPISKSKTWKFVEVIESAK